MGITNALGDYTTGEPIEGKEIRNWALLTGWQDTALFNEDSVTIFKPARTLYLDLNDHELTKDDPRRTPSSETLQALQEIRMFFK
jgi:membrane-anchored protein YejM (alkaline phosphatase superfamily)